MQQEFSSETTSVVWKVLPAVEIFIQSWYDLSEKDEYQQLRHPLSRGLKTAEKYFGMATRSSAQIMNLCEYRPSSYDISLYY